ncbi:MAG: serine protease [Verrucomicrobia bacterium]|nr:serine protease [Verrucomicrobiota bacterium]
MTTVAILFAAGVLLVAVEILVPGAILGILGGLCLLGGVIAAFVQLGGAGGAVATGVALAIGAVTLYLEFVVLPKSRLAKKFSMSETVSSRSQPEVADRALVVGREVIAVTTLAPSGYVELEGRRYEAFCQSGMADAGARLRVVDVDTFRLVVNQIKESL